MILPLKKQITKTLDIKENGRSSDFVTPNFIMGCNGGCSNSYCYTRRFNRKSIYVNDNLEEILDLIESHVLTLPEKEPNQCDSKFWVYDIGCNTDISLHWKDYDWIKVLEFFKKNPLIKSTFATKYVNYNILPYGNEKTRIRFSLMPQKMSDLLEPGTSKIHLRVKAINDFLSSGWDTHINFSPVVVYKDWIQDYIELFKYLNDLIIKKNLVKCEVIFLTHNKIIHQVNLSENRNRIEDFLWIPKLQEEKTSQYGGNNLRYKHEYKYQFIQQFKELVDKYIPWCQIRYIF